MQDASVLLAFALATTVLMLIPGPNMALIVANSLSGGVRYGLLTIAGTTSAMVLQLALVGAGVAGMVDALGHWFAWLRWAGVIYLLVLGVREWRSPPLDLSGVRAQPRSARAVWVRAFLVSLTNPKVLLFLGAFLPQFITRPDRAGAQLLALSAIFVGVAWVVDSLWALLADRLRGWVTARGRLRGRLTGGLLVGAAAGLALARRP